MGLSFMRDLFYPLLGKQEAEETGASDTHNHKSCSAENQKAILETIRERFTKIDPAEFDGDVRPMYDAVRWCVEWNKHYDKYGRWGSYQKDYPKHIKNCFIEDGGFVKVRRYTDEQDDV